MGVKLPDLKYVKYPMADFLDNQSQMSFAAWVRFDAIVSANKQYVFSHNGASQRVSLRKDSTSNKFRFSVTTAEGFVTNDSSTVIVAGTLYHVAGTWLQTNASGMKLYVNAVLETTTNTTTQTTNYNSGGNVALVLGSRTDTGAEYGKCTVENFTLWPGVLLTLTQIQSLYYGDWPHQLDLNRPGIFLPLFGSSVARLPDYSGNDRHIESGNINGAVADSIVGRWMNPMPFAGGFAAAGVSVGGSPNPWVLITTPQANEVLHPTANYVNDGLTNGTVYEFYISTMDQGGNESQPSATVEATPVAPSVTVSALSVAWRRDRRFSKFRSQQQ